MMSRKHYVFVAEALAMIGNDAEGKADAIKRLAYLFKVDNQRFDSERFRSVAMGESVQSRKFGGS